MSSPPRHRSTTPRIAAANRSSSRRGLVLPEDVDVDLLAAVAEDVYAATEPPTAVGGRLPGELGDAVAGPVGELANALYGMDTITPTTLAGIVHTVRRER
ncbi:hypothetical protein ACTWPT_37395 [Nonomuraea sp. 3N208]|uniref:hypothetical protein n=1 Tax=Nonomuraea sp. 3N208 TaxID=3457421 RepID=UPI003FD357C6